MYNVSNDFKSAILNNARRIKAYITFNENSYDIQKCTLDSNIYSSDSDSFIGTFIGKSGTLKVNKQDSLKLENESFHLFFGIQLNSDNDEYVPMGNMNVYEKTSDTEYKFMDNKMFFNKTFDTAKLTYPTTPLKAAQEACRQAGVILATLDFPNNELEIPSEVFFGYDATCADVIVAVAQASCTFAVINRDDQLEFKWFDKVDFTVPLDNQYAFPIAEMKYGPINSLVLAREPQNDNVYIQDEASIEQNGLTELKISDNPFLDIDRYSSRNAIWNRINGFSYDPLTANTPGYFHIDPGDVISLQLEDKSYLDLYVMNHSLEYSGGIKSSFSTPALSKNQINYSIASTLESKILKTELTVDKIKGEIESYIKETNDKIENLDIRKYSVSLENTGTELINDNSSITLSAKVYSDNDDVTDDQNDLQFQWYKNEDKFRTGKNIVVTTSDVDAWANIYCSIIIGDITKVTQTITITDQTDIAQLDNSFLDFSGASHIQQLNDGMYFPDYTKTPISITPSVIDGLVNVDLNECEIIFKRLENGQEVNLVEGENVTDGVLTVSKNLMDANNAAITYVCEISYKNSTIRRHESLFLNVIGADGEDAILLNIHSSNGLTFKNTKIATTFTVTIHVAGNLIDTSQKMYDYFGEQAQIRWKVRYETDDDYSYIPDDDPRLSDNGFIFTLTADDIRNRATFDCELEF